MHSGTAGEKIQSVVLNKVWFFSSHTMAADGNCLPYRTTEVDSVVTAFKNIKFTSLSVCCST